VAIYHLHVQVISRRTGRSAVASAAYRSAEKIYNERDGLTHDYTRKTGVVHTEIMLPGNTPREFKNRAILWNAVEKAEKRGDAQTAREIDIALPVEFEHQEHIKIIQDYVRENFVERGMCADVAIHDKGDGNPHAHVMLTTRHVTVDGFGGKNRDWNDKTLLESWRENWAEVCNERLMAKGLDEGIDHRTLEAQGIDREPTIHIGVVAKRMEQTGQVSDRMGEYREIVARNEARTPEAKAEYIHELAQAFVIVDREISTIQRDISDIERERNIARVKAEDIEERAEMIRQMPSNSRSYQQAVNYFTKTYHIAPEESETEIRRLESKAKELKQAKTRLHDKLPPLLIDREEFKNEYHRQRLLADVHRDRERILKRFEQLEKETRDKLTPKGKQERLRILGLLEESKERERVRERDMYRER